MLTELIYKTATKHGLFGRGDRVIVGVSGGPDSVCLLYVLRALSKRMGLSLFAAHLDHRLRKDSASDAEYVRKLCLKLKVPCFIGAADLKGPAKTGSVEETARFARLKFFQAVAKKVKADKVALGHNLDDQAETVLMRILRGTGLCGLGGILPKRKIGGVIVVRPLLEVRRREIESYLRKKGVKPRIDPTNLEDIYFRNKIRNRLLPLLEREFNRNIKEILANMAESLALDYDYLQQLPARLLGGRKPDLNLKKLSALHPAVRRLLFREAFAAIKGDTRRLTFRHIREIEDLFANRPMNSIVDLPSEVSALKKKNSLLFYRRKKQ